MLNRAPGARRRIGIAGLTALALLAAACGSDNNAAPDTTTAATQATVVATTEAPGPTTEVTGATTEVTGATTATTDTTTQSTQPVADVKGSLTWYSLQPTSATDVIVAAFTKKYPDVNVNVVNFQGPDILDRIGAEAQAGTDSFDILDMAGRRPLAPFSEQGILAKWEPQALKLYPEEIRATMADADKWVFAGNSHGLCVNTDVISEPPTSYEDLVDPRFAGEIVYGAPLGTGFGQTLTVESKGFWGEGPWKQFWTGLGQQKIEIVDTPATAIDLLVRGERGVMLWCNISAFRSAVAKGAPLKWVWVNPDVANEVTIAMSAKAKSPAAAEAFVEFMLGEEGQALVGDAFGLRPLLPGAPAPSSVPAAPGDVKVILTPSKFAIDELGGLGERDPAAYADYVAFITQALGL